MARHRLAAAPEAPTEIAEHRPAVQALAGVPLRIDAENCAWLVEHGQIDLFALATSDGEPSGARHPLCSIAAGELILSLPAMPDRAVIAVGHLDSAIRRLEPGEIAAWPSDHLAMLIEPWIIRIALAAFGDRSLSAELVADAGQRISVAAGRHLHAPRQVVWLSPHDGKLMIDGSPEPLTVAMPIAGGLSLHAVEDSSVDCLSTGAALAAGIADAGLELFHRAVAAGLAARTSRADEAARGRIVARAALDRQSMAAGLQQLASIAGASAPLAAPTVGDDPMIAALTAVADHQGITVSRMPRFASAAESTLRLAARANGVGLRRVLLRAEWWRRDNGALLAWHGETRDPVALLPAGAPPIGCGTPPPLRR